MTLRRSLFAIALASIAFITAAPGAFAAEGVFDRDGSYRTTNFRVYAPDRELAQTFGDMAERYRSEKAVEWLGREMPAWPERCPLRVEINMRQSGGATTFSFGTDRSGRSGVISQEMKIWGETRQLLYSVLPHEVTHTVLAYHFQRPVPRWADEGGSVLSENDEECFQHDIRCREILNQGRGIRLRVLFTLKDYPRDMIVVYAQGYSICQYLIDRGGRSKFLEFVGMGMKNDNRNWEAAVQQMYGYSGVDELEEAWIDALRNPPTRVAARNRDTRNDVQAQPTGRSRADIRSSAVPALPLLESPVVARGVAPERDRPTQGVGPRGYVQSANPTLAPSLCPDGQCPNYGKPVTNCPDGRCPNAVGGNRVVASPGMTPVERPNPPALPLLLPPEPPSR